MKLRKKKKKKPNEKENSRICKYKIHISIKLSYNKLLINTTKTIKI